MNELALTSKKENRKIKNREMTKPNFWTEEEDRILKEKAEEYNYKNWNSIANFIPGRTSIQCSARYRRIRPGLIKGAWDKEEDNKLLSLYEKYGKNWAAISKEMPHRTGKQIRDRFLNSLDSKFQRGKFTEEEDQTIIKYYKIYGNSWAKIAKKLKTRTGDMVKNRFYSSLKKTIFKNKSLLKRKRERCAAPKNKVKIEEEFNNSEINNKANSKEQRNKITIGKEEKKDQKEISNFLDKIKKSFQDNEELINQKKNNMSNSTNNNSIDTNNYSLDMENKNNNHIIIKNSSENSGDELNENLNNSKQSLNNTENDNKIENDNKKIENDFKIEKDNKIENDNNTENDNKIENVNVDFNLEDNTKKNELLNYSELNSHFKINCDLFSGLNDNINNNFNSFNQKDEVDERLEKLKNFPKLEYKQCLKEKLDIIYDLENIIYQKLFSLQKEIENN